MTIVYPILLAGGSGTRLWPLSRRSFPKQFSKIIDGKTLFQSAALRSTPSNEINFAPHITITNSDFRFIVQEQLEYLGISQGTIMIEPSAKNTGPAILAASIFTFMQNPEAIVLVLPSDHKVTDTVLFQKSVKIGLDKVKIGKIVTFGIKPTRPETGYGYLKIKKNELQNEGVSIVAQFVEKPKLHIAKEMLKSENYLWNAGIFLFKAKDIITAFHNFLPETSHLVNKAVKNAKEDLRFLRLDPTPWKEIRGVSVDYAVMEKTKNLVAVPYSSKWSDLGDWDAVWSEFEKDKSGVALTENAHAIDCSNSLIRSENPNQQVVGLGLDNLIAIAMPDAVLVAKKDRAQDVKKVVDYLKSAEVSQADNFPIDYRPWGWFEILAYGEMFQVKRICVKPGAALSLQSHKFRSEHWVVVEGTAKVTIEDTVKTIKKGESVFVPVGKIHRMENPGAKLMTLIEIQTGSYLGEDDIVRYEDIYARK